MGDMPRELDEKQLQEIFRRMSDSQQKMKPERAVGEALNSGTSGKKRRRKR